MVDLTSLRAALAAARAKVTEQLYQATKTPSAAMSAALAKARAAEVSARTALNAGIAAYVAGIRDCAESLQGDVPITLFPVRLETRFVAVATPVRPVTPPIAVAPPVAVAARVRPDPATDGNRDVAVDRGVVVDRGRARVRVGTLQVRIYPDDILARTHEPELTDDEWTAGRAYWLAGDSLSSWAALLAQYPAPRAAWIVSQTQTSQRPPARATSWTRPAEAILPDRFTVFAYRAGTLVASASTGPVAEPLTLTIAPTVDAARQQAVAGGGPMIDRDLLWTLEYEEAKAAGMAVDLPVYAEDWANGYDLLLAVGVKGSFSVSDAATAMKAIFDGHHYTNGLAFVPRGTPTSNAPGAASGYPAPDSGGAASFAVERGHPPAGDGTRWASWMGIDRSTVAHIAATGLNEDSAAQDMLTALWPATVGYHLEQMMAPANPALPAPFDSRQIEAAYQYTRSNLRPGGPLPAFRVGSVPYGVFPVTSVGRFAGANRTPLAASLNGLRPRLLAASQNAAAVRPGSTDPDGDLLSVLRLDATSHGFLVQPLLGSELQNRLGALPGLNLASALNVQDLQGQTAKAELASAGLPATNAPRIALASFGTASSFVGILVSSQADRDQPLPKTTNYISWIQNQLETGGTELASGVLPPGYESTLLYQLLRHAVLVEQARTANPGIRVIEITALATIAPDTTGSTPGPLPAPPAAPLSRLRPPTPAASPRLADIDAALGRLTLLPVSQLERLLEETLDVCSHRFDAWMTSLATSSLRHERLAVSAAVPAPPSHFGAYGWVESLRPSATPFSPGPGGFIHAPSTNHAQTAAVLRNAYLARSSTGATQYALDLSSARVRVGQSLLARIRDGESLGEILGTELEKRLRADPALSTSLNSIRTAFATPSSPMTDGLAAVLAWRKNRVAPPFTAALSAAFGEVSRLLDAAADLLTAEGVYQMVRGNPPGAAAALDALAQGVRPPDPEIAHVPVSGTAVTHRVAAVLTRTPAAGWPTTPTPRAAAGQYVDEWVGTMLGDPSRVRCRVAAAVGAPVIVTLAQLGLRPLDVVALAAAPPGQASTQDPEIDRRVRVAAGIPGTPIAYEPDPAWAPSVVTFPAIMELARTVDRFIAGARPLAAIDLSLSSDGTVDATDPGVAARAQASLTALKALDLATPATLRTQLRATALFGLTGAFPSDTATTSELAALAARVEAERQTRIKEASSVTNPEEIVRAVFGRRIPTVGQFTPPAAFQAALTSPPLGVGANDASKWLQGASRVRSALDRWRRARIYAEALGGAPPPLRVVQLPHSPTAKWAALPFAPGGAPPSGTVSIVLAQPSGMPTAGAWAGLFIDEWSELIPSASQQTGVAFNYVSPRAEAPLALLVAVPPAAAPTWSTDVLADIVRETFELTKMRLLTPDLLPSFSLLLPATSLQVNSAGDQLSTYFHGKLAGPIRVLPIAG